MTGDQLEILVVSALSALLVGTLGLGVGRLLRHRSLRWQLALVAAVAVLSVLGGVLAIAQRMLISAHDLEVVTLVGLVAATISMVVALAVAATLTRWSRTLRDDVRRVGGADPLVERRGPAELQELSVELAAAHLRLAEGRQREARLEHSRRELISWVSHDLRTPLAGIRAMTESLEDGLSPDPVRYHHQIRAEVDRMVRMVDDLFELSRIHAGVLALALQPVVVGDLVSEAIAAADPLARSRRVRLGGEVPAGLEVIGDPAGLTRVLANLLVNGIRHTPTDGTVRVVARALPGAVEIGVSDGCGGIPDDERARVFDVAYRGGDARTPDAPDDAPVHRPSAGRLDARAGLGLAIVKGIVEAHAGDVRVSNAAHPPGCVFSVRLPA